MNESRAFKEYYDAEMARRLAGDIAAVYPNFPTLAFVEQVAPQLPPLELKQRVAIFSAALRDYLPADYPAALQILLATLGPPLTENQGMFKDRWHLMPMAHFVEVYGHEHFDESMAAIHAITQRFTGEWAIRPFLQRYPARALAVLQTWVYDESFHVRRLVSEGTRPRLPWATRIPEFSQNPQPMLALLSALKHDPSAYVRRSVANHLNDIGKEHPDLLLATMEEWNADATEATRWIINHALRSLVKQGHPAALRLVGATEAQVALEAFMVDPARLSIGESTTLHLRLRSLAEAPQQLVIDYVLHLAGAAGRQARRKVFKLRTLSLAAGETFSLSRRHSFQAVSVRRYYPGPHRFELQVNGNILAGVDVEVY
jgi:3-methyladenine DNA glycosylase AlkC